MNVTSLIFSQYLRSREKPDLADWLQDEQKSAAKGEKGGRGRGGGGAFSNRAPIFFEQQPRLARAQTMHSGFNKTATIRGKLRGWWALGEE